MMGGCIKKSALKKKKGKTIFTDMLRDAQTMSNIN